MKRLTRRKEDGTAYVQLYSDPDRPADLIAERARKEVEVIERLARYEDLEEAGRLVEGKPVDFGYLADWYISSVMDDDEPVWTDAHIDELLQDFILVPKPEDEDDTKEEAEAKLREMKGTL